MLLLRLFLWQAKYTNTSDKFFLNIWLALKLESAWVHNWEHY